MTIYLKAKKATKPYNRKTKHKGVISHDEE
jgi:hypothetical protein